jgi:hypothetical protein
MIPLLLILLTMTGAATASPLTYTYTINGNVPDGPVSARVILTLDTSAHTLDILLANLLIDPTSDGQLVSGLSVLGLTGSPVFVSSAANEGNPPGSASSPRPGGTGWGFGAIGGGYELCIICPGSINPPGKTAPPSLLIIGPPDSGGQYSNANASIYAHSPYLFEEATFHLTGVTNTPADDKTPAFPGVNVLFGSEGIQLAAGDPVITNGAGTLADVPEPGAWLLVAGGLTLICLGKKHMERFQRVLSRGASGALTGKTRSKFNV